MGWLPRAIAAPTPVSSLVHRSTLVTAGFFLLFFFGYKFLLMNLLVFFFGLVSLVFSSFFSLLETDIKKLVAWRTLSQLGLCFIFFSLGGGFFGFLHIISHAFFKSSLFLIVGFYIFFNSSQQDFRLSGGLRFSIFYLLGFIVCIFSLISLFFLGGIFTKDLFLEFFFLWDLIFFGFF